MTACVNVPPFYVATSYGFLMRDGEPPRARYYTVPDVRLATPFDTFEEADDAGRAGAWRVSGPGISYFAILCVPEGSTE